MNGHTLIGLDNGAMILAGRYYSYGDDFSSKFIWMLKNNTWSHVGHLKEVWSFFFFLVINFEG